MRVAALLVFVCFVAVVCGQQPDSTNEGQPSLTTYTCDGSGCTSQSQSVTIDANWRWIHDSNSKNCYTGNTWDTSICSDPTTCASKCVLGANDVAKYSSTYGISTSGSALNLKFITTDAYGTNVGSRVYLMKDSSTYQILKLKNREFAFDVNVANLDCGLNGALYLVEMAADGGKSKYSGNKAGAMFGTGYCDAQCPNDLKFINGEANIVNWTPSPNNKNTGTGSYGSCCAEMDLWEANKISTAYTPHPCNVTVQTRCSGDLCGNGENNRYVSACDKDGCDFNSYRQGEKGFYGPSKTVDTTQPLTVVTQFITEDNTDSGDLVEIRRIYKQNGKVISNSATNFDGIDAYDSITDDYCDDQKALFGDQNQHKAKGGLKAMGESLDRGMVLVMSLWDDYASNMLWLDSNMPKTGDATKPGVARGNCATSSGVPADVERDQKSASVAYSNVKWGVIGTTTAGVSGPTTSGSTPGSTTGSSSSSKASTTGSNGSSTPGSTTAAGTSTPGSTTAAASGASSASTTAHGASASTSNISPDKIVTDDAVSVAISAFVVVACVFAAMF